VFILGDRSLQTGGGGGWGDSGKCCSGYPLVFWEAKKCIRPAGWGPIAIGAGVKRKKKRGGVERYPEDLAGGSQFTGKTFQESLISRSYRMSRHGSAGPSPVKKS